ncbi:MAG TPA: response regulator [Chthonomonadaceae bacterium]|nr:response regulator [Chthonomonadaceae bacterium]
MARILVVDDENNIRLTMRLALQHSGHAVITAADGPEGLAAFGDGSAIDLVLLDQRMPGMQGLEVLREMRRIQSAARIIMVTAFGTVDLAVEAMKAGATDFLRKPFTADVLRGAVQSALSAGREEARTGITFVSTTVNGYRIEFRAHSGRRLESEFSQTFTVVAPNGSRNECTVHLPDYVQELVRAHIDCEEPPGGDRFWQAVCEEALANYLWQNAEAPHEGSLQIDELTSGLTRFIDAVIAA